MTYLSLDLPWKTEYIKALDKDIPKKISAVASLLDACGLLTKILYVKLDHYLLKINLPV